MRTGVEHTSRLAAVIDTMSDWRRFLRSRILFSSGHVLFSFETDILSLCTEGDIKTYPLSMFNDGDTIKAAINMHIRRSNTTSLKRMRPALFPVNRFILNVMHFRNSCILLA